MLVKLASRKSTILDRGGKHTPVNIKKGWTHCNLMCCSAGHGHHGSGVKGRHMGGFLSYERLLVFLCVWFVFLGLANLCTRCGWALVMALSSKEA